MFSTPILLVEISGKESDNGESDVCVFFVCKFPVPISPPVSLLSVGCVG